MKNSNDNRPDFCFPDPCLVDWGVENNDDIDEIKNEFINSSRVMLETIEGAAMRIESNPADADALQEINRLIHTMKGDSYLIGISLVGDLLHQAESVITWMELHGECPTQFILTLKDWLSVVIHGESHERSQWTKASSAQPESSIKQTGSFKTLIVDDNHINRLVLRKILETYGPTEEAANGIESIEMFEAALDAEEPYDLICMDIMMPEMDGQQALREIRKIETARGNLPSSGVKIVMITALNDLRNVSDSYSELCDGYLVKPVDVNAMREELGKLDLTA